MLRKNERGFTVAESLLSLSILLLAAAVIFPLLFTMMMQLDERWQKLKGMRHLYEQSEQHMYQQGGFSVIKGEEEDQFELLWEEEGNRTKVCFQSNRAETCIKEH